jgi:methylglutamate dehydrogenase subunit A
MAFPAATRYLIIGAGIHGLSTAWHLGRALRQSGRGSGQDILVPVFDRFCENVYVIADSNHGYKMLGVGQLVAEDICGRPSELLQPFRFSRFAAGKLHPTSNSPFPWS